MQKAAPDASPADISDAWYKLLSLALGTLGEGLGVEGLCVNLFDYGLDWEVP